MQQLARLALIALAGIVGSFLAPAPAAHAALPYTRDLASQANITISGPSSGSQGGFNPVDAGDVNGDGRSDLIVGAPYDDNNSRNNSGSAYVIFGQASPTDVALSSLGTRGFRIDGVAANDHLGDNVYKVGDVNGDGKTDLAISAPTADNGKTDSGAVVVVFGKSSTTPIDVASLGSKGFKILGASAGDQLGDEPPVGDVNGDGIPDILVGCGKVDTSVGTDSGAGYVVFGKSTTTSVDLSSLGSQGFRILGPAANAELGSGLAPAGDVNGDGTPDIIAGAGLGSYAGRSYAGASYVIFGKSSTSDVNTAALGSGGYTIGGPSQSAVSGYTVAGIGDVNGDTIPDQLVGARTVSYSGRSNAGAAYVVYGKSSTTAIDLNSLGTQGYVIGGAAADDNIDHVGALGDVNGDGVPDMIVSAASADFASRTDSGASYVVYGKRGAVFPVDLASLGTQGYLLGGPSAGATLGAISGESAGDVNGDGLDDVAVGATEDTLNGAGYIVYSDKDPPTTAISHTPVTGGANQYFDSAAKKLFYNTASAGSFTLTDTANDTDSGVLSVDFPTLSATGFTGAALQDSAAPYQSNTYSYTTANTTAPAGADIITQDGRGNRTTDTIAFARDVTASAPTIAVANTVRNGQAISATADDGAGAGVASVGYRYCAGATCSWAAGTAIGTPQASAPYAVTWSSQPTDGQYTIVARSTDRVGNVADATQTVTVDNTAPTGTLGVAAGTRADRQFFDSAGSKLFYNPSATGGFTSGSFNLTATGSDANGVERVDFPAIAATGFTGLALSDSASPFASNTYTFSSANTTAPANASAAIVDNAGNTAAKSLAFARDVTGPSTSLTAPSELRNGQLLSASPSDSGAGVKSVEFRYCPGSSCTYGASAAIGSVTTSAPYQATWSSQPADGTYTVLARSTDNVANTTDTTKTVTVDNAAPTAAALSMTKLTGNAQSYFDATAGRVYYNPTGSGGSFKLTGTATDATGLASVDYPPIADTGFNGLAATPTGAPFDSSTYTFGNANTTAPSSKTVTYTDGVGNSTTRTLAFTRDVAAPTISATSASVLRAGQSVSATASDGGAGLAPVEFRYCPGASCAWGSGTAIGTDNVAPYSVAWSAMPADGTYTVIARATDNVGNTTDAPQTLVVDKTGPALSLGSTAGSAPDRQHFDSASSKLFYNPSSAGGFTSGDFTLGASASDANGMASVAFPAWATTGFTGSAVTDNGSPFVSNSYTFAATNTMAPAAGTVTATDSVGNTTSKTVAPVRDLTAPAAFSITPGAGRVSEGEMLSANPTDAGSGVGSVAFRYCPGTSCPWGSGTAISTADTTAPYTADWNGQPADGTYTVIARATDNVANTTDATATFDIDNVGPTDATVSSTAIGRPDLQHFDPTTSTLFYNPAASGSFKLNGTVGDPSQVANVAFPAIATTGFAGSSATPTSSPFESAEYTFGAANATAPASADVVFTDLSSNTSTRTIDFARDVTPPTGGSISYPSNTSGTLTVTTSPGNDFGAGIAAASGTLERQAAALSGTTCGTYAGWTPASAHDTTTSTGHCYRYRYSIADRVGNRATYSSATVVKRPAPAPPAATPQQPQQPQQPPTTPKLKSKPLPRPPAIAVVAPLKISTNPIQLTRKGVAPVKARCQAKKTCRGTLTIYVLVKRKPVKHKAKAHRSVATISKAKAKPRLRKVVLGRKSYKIKPGKSVAIKVHISRKGRRTILAKRKSRCKINFKGGGRTFTRNVTIKRPKRH